MDHSANGEKLVSHSLYLFPSHDMHFLKEIWLWVLKQKKKKKKKKKEEEEDKWKAIIVSRWGKGEKK